MCRQSLSAKGSLVLVLAAILLMPSEARSREDDLRRAFRRAVVIHRNLLCGGHLLQGLQVLYTVEPRSGLSMEVARDRMLEVLWRRAGDLDRNNVAVYRHGRAGIEVQLYGSAHPRATLDVLERPGVLGFHAVDTESTWWEALGPAMKDWRVARPGATLTIERSYDDVTVRADNREELEAFAATLPDLPAERILGFQEDDHLVGGAEPSARWRLYLLHAEAPVHGGHLTSATVTHNEYNHEPVISLQFNGAGATAFADLSEALVQRYLAILLDGRVMSAPKVMERIEGGRAQITLGSGRSYETLHAEAQALATVLQAGSHPATLVKLSEGVLGFSVTDGWRAMGPLPFTAQALALLLTIHYGCF